MTVAATPAALAVTAAKVKRLLREVKDPYANAYDMAYSATVQRYERTSGGGDSDPTEGIIEDERKAQIRKACAEITKATNEYHKALSAWKVKMELAAGFRVRRWDSLEEKARVAKMREQRGA